MLFLPLESHSKISNIVAQFPRWRRQMVGINEELGAAEAVKAALSTHPNREAAIRVGIRSWK
jgi:hypothetical protein